mgnify:CR=1 FL=1
MRKTKYCQNIGEKHLREKNSPSNHYCVACYTKLKERYKVIEAQGGPIAGLRAARCLADGSFGYERSANEKERNLRAFFYYVMPHIPDEKAEQYVKEIAHRDGVNEHCTNDGIKRVRTYKH